MNNRDLSFLNGAEHGGDIFPLAEVPECHSRRICLFGDGKVQDFNYQLFINGREGKDFVIFSKSLENKEYRYSGKIKVEVGRGEAINLIVVQQDSDSCTAENIFDIELKGGATLNMSVITLSGSKVDNKFNVRLQEKEAICNLSGFYMGSEERVIDTTLNLTHSVGECVSSQLFKGILGGVSRASFTGDIVVEKDAQKTEAYQANNNLLISDGAKAVSKPELIIYADDVKCSHGSTVGMIGEDELFYMRSRGISLKEAQLLRQQAFAGEVLEKINDKLLRKSLISMVETALREL